MGWKLKGCPRCEGDIQVYRDTDECWYEVCLQCGYRAEIPIIAEKKKPIWKDIQQVEEMDSRLYDKTDLEPETEGKQGTMSWRGRLHRAMSRRSYHRNTD